MQKGSSKNPWNKSNLRNRCRARWAKGKTGIGLDEHCANSYIPQHIYTIIQCAEHAGCRNLHMQCSSSPMPVLPFAHLALHRFRRLLLFYGFLEDPFCTVLRQSYIFLPFLNGFYTPLLYILTSFRTFRTLPVKVKTI